MTYVDEYLKTVPERERKELERIRKLTKKMVPGAEEVKTYAMPGFKYKGKYLLSLMR